MNLTERLSRGLANYMPPYYKYLIEHVQTARKAWREAEQLYRESAPLHMVPASIQPPPLEVDQTWMTSCHGTSLSRVEDQIRQGRLESRGKWVFIWPERASKGCISYALAASAASGKERADDAVILELRHHPDNCFNHLLLITRFVVPGKDRRAVYIKSVQRVNPEYLEWEKSFDEKVSKMAQELMRRPRP